MATAAEAPPLKLATQDHVHHSDRGPYLRNLLLSGMCSGVVEGVLMQPLEFVKTRLQINEGPRIGLGSAFRDIVREKGFLHLYRGGAPEILGMLPRSTAALASLDLFKTTLAATSADGKLTTEHAYLAGAGSGAFEALSFAPSQVIKVRMADAQHLDRYKNSRDCLRQILAEEGPSALFNGLGPTLWRVVIWNSLYYGTMHQIQAKWFEQHPLQNSFQEALRKLGVGIVVGIGATVFNSPFDVVKSRVQTQLPGNKKYRYTLPSLVTIIREEGVVALYKGFAAKSLRLGLGQSIGYVVFTDTLQRLSDASTSH